MLNLFEDQGQAASIRFIEAKMGAGLWSWNLHSGEMTWSEGQYALFGVEPSPMTMTYERLLAFVHPDDRRNFSSLASTLGAGLPFACECRIIRAKGRMLWLAVRGEALFDARGQVHRAVGTTQDITARYEKQAFARRDARFRAFINTIAPIVWSAKPNGAFVDLDESCASLASPELDAAAATENNRLCIVHPDDRARTHAAWNTAVATRDFFDIEHKLRSSDGDYRLFHTSGTPHCGQDGTFLGWQGICVDLSTRQPKAASDLHSGAVTGAQVRAARGILKWSVKDLAAAAGVSSAVVRRIEDFDGPPARKNEMVGLIRRALVSGGVEFLFPPDGRAAVRPCSNEDGPHRQARMARNAAPSARLEKAAPRHCGDPAAFEGARIASDPHAHSEHA